MGRLDRIKQVQQESNDGIWTIDLNEGNVKKIFNICLAKPGTPKENIRDSVLFLRLTGFTDNSTPISFDKEVLYANRQGVEYLFGQLRYIHEGKALISTENGVIKYNNVIWTNDSGILMSLLHLGRALGIITPFDAKSMKAATTKLSSTLSPQDPNFPAWWEAHRSKWETGQ